MLFSINKERSIRGGESGVETRHTPTSRSVARFTLQHACNSDSPPRNKKRNPLYNKRVALFTNDGGGGNRTSLPIASDHAPALQVHCTTVRSEDLQTGTIAGGLQGECISVHKDNAISMPSDLTRVVATWLALSQEQKGKILAIIEMTRKG